MILAFWEQGEGFAILAEEERDYLSISLNEPLAELN